MTGNSGSRHSKRPQNDVLVEWLHTRTVMSVALSEHQYGWIAYILGSSKHPVFKLESGQVPWQRSVSMTTGRTLSDF